MIGFWPVGTGGSPIPCIDSELTVASVRYLETKLGLTGRPSIFQTPRGSFSAVGREAGIGQPAVSKQIRALERHLGAQLVLRTSRRVVITEAGKTLYESAKQLVDDFDAVESAVGDRHQSPRGLVRLNTAPGYGRLCVTPLLAEFFQRYPEVAIDLSVTERHIDLVGEGIDLAIRHGRLVDSSLTARKLSETDLVLAASPSYLAKKGVPTRLSDLDTHTCIIFARNT